MKFILMKAAGELVSAEGLAWPDQAKLVRADKDGACAGGAAQGSASFVNRGTPSGHYGMIAG
jgi:hypothetical protein